MTAPLIPEPILSGTTREYQIDTLLGQAQEALASDHMATGDRTLMGFNLPPWQRDETWTEAQKRRFIEGIFLGLGCGYYVVHQMDWDEDANPLPMAGWLLDGQQRIAAIRDFVYGPLTIFDGVGYTDLDRPTQLRRFRRQAFPCVEIPYQDDEEILKEVYRRLNFGGTPHTAADLARVGS